MSKLRKPFYHLDEVIARWEMSERDMTAFVLSDELTLSTTVAGLRIEHGVIEDVDGRIWHRIPEGIQFVIGTVELERDDAWRILREGAWAITSLKAPHGRYRTIEDANCDNTHLVQREDLVICRAEIERFEQELGLSSQSDMQIRRGAPPRFDWDGFWVEVCRIVHNDGLPETQNELVGRMAEWFEVHRKTAPDESTIKKKLRPLWQELNRSEEPQRLAKAR